MKLNNREQQILDFAILVGTIILIFIAFVIFMFACREPEKVHFRDAVRSGQEIDGTSVVKPSRNEF